MVDGVERKPQAKFSSVSYQAGGAEGHLDLLPQGASSILAMAASTAAALRSYVATMAATVPGPGLPSVAGPFSISGTSAESRRRSARQLSRGPDLGSGL